MIETANETRCKNPSCGKPVTQIPGHRRREYCNDTCKQTAYRLRKEQPHHGVTIVDDRQIEQQNIKRIEQYAIDCSIAEGKAKERIAELEQELTRYREITDLMDRAKMETRFMDLGKQVEYRPLTEFTILGGYGYWQDFMKRAKDETLLKAIATAEYFLDGLIALRGNPQQRRIVELERQVSQQEAHIAKLEQEIATLKAKPGKRKKPEEPLSLPIDLVYWRQFANLHGVSQNEVTQAVSRG